MVFPVHRRAAVLCDRARNCATPAHIVVFDGAAMTMATYCRRQRVRCVRTVMMVNSPRMQRALRVPSRSHRLQFTALAAARLTRVEEWLLATAVALGV